jgi:DNA-binding NtrC family response regulator
MPSPILLIAPESIARAVADALRRSLDVVVETAANRRTGLAALRRGEFCLVLLDEALAAADPQATDLLYQNAVSAPVLEINFIITGPQRIVRQARAALTRRAHDLAQARAAAAATLHGELNASLTGLLLESQLALREACPEHEEKLKHLVELAGKLRHQLRI